MIKKSLVYYVLLSILLLVTGCVLEKTSSELAPKIGQANPQASNDKNIAQETITNQQMKDFFASYLISDEAAILEFNQRPKQIDDDYWRAYKSYKRKINEDFGHYLSAEAKKKLHKQYIQDDFHYPRFVEINDYMIIGITKVEEAKIISKERQNNNYIYHVRVTAIVKAINTKQINERYRWDDQLGYYVIHDQGQDLKDKKLKEDKLKVSLNYLVESPSGAVLEVDSVREKAGIYLGIDERINTKNNYFISRVHYMDQVKKDHKEKIHKFLDEFMKQKYNFYTYYTKAYHTHYDMVKIALEKDLKLKGIIKLQESYQSQFSPLIIPLKDDMDFIIFNSNKDVEIKPHISSSENYSIYQVKVNVEAILLDGRIKYYEYIYQFTLENDMILSVRYINQSEKI